MNGPASLSAIDPNINLLDLFETKPDTFKPEDLAELEAMAQRAVPEHDKRVRALADAEDAERQLAQRLTELDAMKKDATLRAQRLLLVSADETIAMTTNCDVTALAARLRPVQDEVTLLTDAKDLLNFKRFPAARIATLDAALKLRQIEELLAVLCASISQARTLAKLIKAGVFQNESRVALISEETERLRAAARECTRQVRLAEDALHAERQRQTAAEQQRLATGLVTRAEIATCVPVH